MKQTLVGFKRHVCAPRDVSRARDSLARSQTSDRPELTPLRGLAAVFSGSRRSALRCGMRLGSFAFSIMLLVATPATQAADTDPAAPAGIISHIRRQPIDSTALAAIGYSKRLHALEIEFRNGAIYRYLDVPNDAYRQLLSAESKARYYDQNIRGRYRSVHVRARRSD